MSRANDPSPPRAPRASVEDPESPPAAYDEEAEQRAARGAAALRDELRREARPLTTSGLGRLWQTGRSAASAASAVLSGRLRGRGDGLGAADLESVARLAERLGSLKGLAMKAGQLLGYVDATLAPEARALLSVLQTQSAPSPFESIEAVVRQALGERAEALIAHMDREPIAVASIAQVHRARLADGRDVAVKVRHPGIVEAMEADFRSAGAGAAIARVLMPGAAGAVRGYVEEVRTAVLEECDLSLEASRQLRFAALYAGDPVIAVPRVVPEASSDAVLTSEWLAGRSFDELLASHPSQAERDRLGVALFDFYVGTLYRHALFHADPHPGNYAFPDEGRIVVYDFGCVRTFERPLVRAVANLVVAVASDDEPRMREALAALGARAPRDAAGFAHVRALMRGFFAPLLTPGPRPVDPGAGFEARTALRDKRAVMKLGLPRELLFLFRLRFGLYAVLARLGAVADWASIERELAARGGARSEPPRA